MKYWSFIVCCVLAIVVTQRAGANEELFADEGVQSFQQDKDAWRREVAVKEEPREVLPEIKTSLGATALYNVEHAEQVFCYEVAAKPNDYSGYVLDGFAITGFCGVLGDDLKKMVLNDLFMNKKNVLFNVKEDCSVHPRVMLRFMRGVDATDVLLSSPCHSYAVFYAGKISVFNTKTAAKVLDALIVSFQKNRVDFVSPAILGQLLPIGIPQTPEQKALVSNTPKPVRKWVEDESAAKPKEENKGGWNNLNF